MTRVHSQEVMMAACSDSCYLLPPVCHCASTLESFCICECMSSVSVYIPGATDRDSSFSASSMLDVNTCDLSSALIEP